MPQSCALFFAGMLHFPKAAYTGAGIDIPFTGPALDAQSKAESFGMYQLRRISGCLERIPRTMALILDDDATAALDSYNFRRAARLMNKARCQVIAVMRRGYECSLFPSARVFECAYGKKGSPGTGAWASASR